MSRTTSACYGNFDNGRRCHAGIVSQSGEGRVVVNGLAQSPAHDNRLASDVLDFLPLEEGSPP